MKDLDILVGHLGPQDPEGLVQILVVHAKERSLTSDDVERKMIVELPVLLLQALDNEALNTGLPRFAAKHLQVGKLLLDWKIFVILERERDLAACVPLKALDFVEAAAV